MKSLNSINKRLVGLGDAVGRREPPTTTIGPGFIRLHLMKRIGLFDILLQHNDLAAIEDWADLAQDDLDFLEYVNEQ